jgi:hypothetical protein
MALAYSLDAEVRMSVPGRPTRRMERWLHQIEVAHSQHLEAVAAAAASASASAHLRALQMNQFFSFWEKGVQRMSEMYRLPQMDVSKD